MKKSFGFDLDNTLINYSASVEEYCRIKNLIPCTNIGMLREQLGKSSFSDHDWQLAQGWLYTEGLRFAQPGLGSIDLCKYLIQEGYQLFIVSHKTSHTPYFCGSIPLHDIANNWIKKSAIANYFVTYETGGGTYAYANNMNLAGTIEATSFTASSDYRIKENVTNLDDSFSVDNLRPVTYFNKNAKKQDIGFIAHEIQEIFPYLVAGEKDGEQMQSLNYLGLIGVLTKEIKELKKRVSFLENKQDV
jgi:hypothetical protein